MILTIVTPQSSAEHQIAWLELHTPNGAFTIYRGHAPTIVPLKPLSQLIFKLKTGKQQTLTVRDGVAHITREKIEILATPME
jgi:F0F1-type ATP synthase epsilon subunit